MMQSIFMNAAEVMEVLGISSSSAYNVISILNEEMDKEGFLTLRGRVNRRYFEDRFYLDGCYQYELDNDSSDTEDPAPIKRKGLKSIAGNAFVRPEEIIKGLDVSKTTAYHIIQELNDEMSAAGYMVIRGRANRRWMYQKLYCSEDSIQHVTS